MSAETTDLVKVLMECVREALIPYAKQHKYVKMLVANSTAFSADTMDLGHADIVASYIDLKDKTQSIKSSSADIH